jgi:hypothetical protein
MADEQKQQKQEGAAEVSQAAPDLKQMVEDWFFNHFHQQTVLNHPDVFERAVAAKDELLKLLGL